MAHMLKNRRVFWILIIIMAFVVTACGASSTQEQEAVAAAPTVDVQQITGAVLAEVESSLAEPSTDTEAIVQAVVAEVEARLADQSNAAPAVDTDVIVEAVLARLETQLAQEQSATLPVLYDNTTTTDGTLEDALVAVYQRANPSVVYIVVSPNASGSGFVYDEAGYIVTNHHVAQAGSDYEVVFSNGARRRAELVGSDADSDLAVLKVDELPEGVAPLPLAEADDVQVGQLVVAIGNPFGEQGSMSLGIISGLGRSLRSQRGTLSGSYSLPQVIQTDAPINPGNSGGPLLNLAGEVLGVNAAIASETGTNSGVGFSIPVAAVRQVAPSLIQEGAYTYPFMGVGFDDEVSLDEQSVYGLSQTQGAYVVNVTAGGPADEAGLVAANPNTGQGGDLIVKIDAQEIENFSDLNSYLVFHTRAGQTIQITVLREGELVTLPLTLGARP
jgi:S1-C subfamily serine protease